MRVYVAGSSKDIERCELAIAMVRALGYEVTFDWPAHVRAMGSANIGSDAVLAEAAARCFDGAITADLVWLLVPPLDKPTAGAWWEVGAADALGVPVIASEPLYMLPQPCVFLHLPGVRRFADDEEALAAVHMAGARAA